MSAFLKKAMAFLRIFCMKKALQGDNVSNQARPSKTMPFSKIKSIFCVKIIIILAII